MKQIFFSPLGRDLLNYLIHSGLLGRALRPRSMGRDGVRNWATLALSACASRLVTLGLPLVVLLLGKSLVKLYVLVAFLLGSFHYAFFLGKKVLVKLL